MRRKSSEYDRAYAQANQRAARWVRDNHPEVFEQLLVQTLEERGVERRWKVHKESKRP